MTETKFLIVPMSFFFVNIGPQLAQNIITDYKRPYDSYLRKIINSQFHLRPIDQEELNTIIQSLKPKPSTGHDGISVCKLLKSIAAALLQPLTFIINQSLITGIFPHNLKIAKVISVHKKDLTTVLDN